MLQTLEYIKKIYAKNRLSLISTYFLAVAINFSSNYFFKIFNIQNSFISASIHLFFDWIPIFLIAYLIFKINLKLKDWVDIASFFISNLTYILILPIILKIFYFTSLKKILYLFSIYFFRYIIILFIEKYNFKVSKKPFLIFSLLLTLYHYFSLDSFLILKILYFFLTPLGIFYLFADIKTNKKSIKFYGLKILFYGKFIICYFLTFLFAYLLMEFHIDDELCSIFFGMFILIYWDEKVVISIDPEDKTLFLHQGFLINPIIIDIFNISDITSYDCEYSDGRSGRNAPLLIGKAPIIVLKDGTEYKAALLSNFEISIEELKNIVNNIKNTFKSS